jgi:hypothetical protein
MKSQSEGSTDKPIAYLVDTVINGKEFVYLSTFAPKDDWSVVTPLYTSTDIEAAEKKANPGLLEMIRRKSWRIWWHLWTGDHSLYATRRRIEHDARRFGGIVLWDDSQ